MGASNEGKMMKMMYIIVIVHTFALGSDAYNQGLCTTMAENSPGGSFSSIPFTDKPEASLQQLDGILSATMNDDEKPSTLNLGSTKGLVSINRVKYSKGNAALTADTVTAEVEITSTSSTAVREGLDLVAVLDVSGRMEKKMGSVKNAMKLVIMRLTPVDRLSIVIFSDGAARLTPLRSMTPDAQADLAALVDGLTAAHSGGANVRAGLETGLAVVAGRVNTDARTANVFLMSDGRQTVNDARKVDPSEVPVYTFGFGSGDVDHRLLSDLAGRSHGGMFTAVPEGAASLSVPFSQLLDRLLTVVAQDVRLTLTPKTDKGYVDAMALAPSTNYTQAVDDATGVITVMFGTLVAGEGRKVVVTLDLKDSNTTEEYDALLAEAQPMFTAQGRVLQKHLPQDIGILRVPNPTQAPGASATARQLLAAEAIRQARVVPAHVGDLGKDPAAPVPSADEDVTLAAISGDLAYYLRNAIEALRAIEKIIAPRA